MYLPAWLSGLFGKKPLPFKRNGRPISKSLWVVLDIEQLEKRIVPVIAGSDVQFGQAPMDGASYDGVVKISVLTPAPPNSPPGTPPLVAEFSGSGSLIRTGEGQGYGHHILTAAHLGFADKLVTFEMKRNVGDSIVIPVEIPVISNPAYQKVPNGFTFINNWMLVKDIAVYLLTDPFNPSPDRLLVAPFGADQYELYSQNNEVGQNFEFGGYGFGGAGLTGRQANSDGVKRAAANRFDLDGNAARNEVQRVKQLHPFDFELEYGNQSSGTISANASAAQVQAALEAIPALLGNVQVRSVAAYPDYWWISFVNGLANTNVNELIPCGCGNAEVATIKNGNTSPGPDATTLWYDFDNGLAENDLDGIIFGVTELGVTSEGLTDQGDSGGPAFIGQQIAGVISGGGSLTKDVILLPTADSDTPPDINLTKGDASYGEHGVMTRVSSYLNNFIRPTLNPLGANNATLPYDLVFDMRTQVLGNDSTIENLTITAKRSGADIRIEVSGSDSAMDGIYYQAPIANIRSLTIRGSDDNEIIIIEGNLGVGPIEINARDGTNEVHIGDPSIGGNLSDLSANVTVLPGDGVTDLFCERRKRHWKPNIYGNERICSATGHAANQLWPSSLCSIGHWQRQ